LNTHAPPTTSAAADLELMRASAVLDSSPQSAVRYASAILAHSPGHEAAGLLLATACRRLGNAAAAHALLAPLAAAQPASAVLQLELGRACTALGLNAEANTALQAAVALDPRLADAWRELATQRFLAGDTPGGDAAYTKFERLAPQPPELGEAAVAIEDGRLGLATMLLERHLATTPDAVAALHMRALVARAQGLFAEVEHYLLRCLELAPGFAAARFDLAKELCVQLRYAEAAPHLERLLAAAPRNVGYVCLQAHLLRFYGRSDEASALLQFAIAADPEDARLHLHYGLLLREQGEQAGAVDAFRRALVMDPGMTEAYRNLADLKTVRLTAADRGAMQSLADSLPPGPQRSQLEFALGRVFEDEGRPAQAFEHYARGNAMVRVTLNHDPETMSAGVRRSKALYTTRFFADRAGWGSERTDPIFIVGLPRSGSTLLEQILASHSQVEGTRELPSVPAIAREIILGKSTGGMPNYPDPVGQLTRAEVAAYAERYLAETSAHRSLGKPRFVDKMLVNFDHIGLIQLMLPRATIIDARRHPLACCFSCFRQLFGRGQPFSYSLRDMGRHYRDYFDVMEHIDAVLPGRVHRVYYEQLVADPEGVVRRLLGHCGLPFEAGCLKFYENRRVVTTISSEQVRRPINSDAVDQWRNFEPWLGELKEALGDLVERYPRFS
jgi:tetratricopeptide (TPR) repeat protein